MSLKAFKLFLVALTMEIVGLALFEDGSLNYKMVRDGGAGGLTSLVILAVLAASNGLDTVLRNHKTSYIFGTPVSWRTTAWVMMASMYIGYSLVLSTQLKGYWLIVIFTTCAAACLSIAVLDIIPTKNGRSSATGPT